MLAGIMLIAVKLSVAVLNVIVLSAYFTLSLWRVSLC
jgi:hypothetical protein